MARYLYQAMNQISIMVVFRLPPRPVDRAGYLS